MAKLLIAACLATAAILSPAATLAADDAAALVGRWHGSYSCNQGRTGLQLLITKADGLAFEGEFAFHALPENPDVPTGRFAVQGALDIASDRVTIDGLRWLEQPSGYQMVNLSGTLSADGRTIAGTVEFTGCGDFRVTLEGKQGVPGRSKADEGKGK
jgi:hypothetical protein